MVIGTAPLRRRPISTAISGLARRLRRGGRRDADDALFDAYVETTFVTWDDRGLPMILSGPFTDHAPHHTLHVVSAGPTSNDPGRATHAERYRRLVRWCDDAGLGWQPVVGAAPAGGRHELGILTGVMSTSEAVTVGARFDQAAVVELDPSGFSIVPCGDGRGISVPWPLRFDCGLTYDDLTTWRDVSEAILGVSLPRTRCPRCGEPDPQRIPYVTRAPVEPDWIAPEGCVVAPDDPTLHCRGCGTTW